MEREKQLLQLEAEFEQFCEETEFEVGQVINQISDQTAGALNLISKIDGEQITTENLFFNDWRSLKRFSSFGEKLKYILDNMEIDSVVHDERELKWAAFSLQKLDLLQLQYSEKDQRSIDLEIEDLASLLCKLYPFSDSQVWEHLVDFVKWDLPALELPYRNSHKTKNRPERNTDITSGLDYSVHRIIHDILSSFYKLDILKNPNIKPGCEDSRPQSEILEIRRLLILALSYNLSAENTYLNLEYSELMGLKELGKRMARILLFSNHLHLEIFNYLQHSEILFYIENLEFFENEPLSGYSLNTTSDILESRWEFYRNKIEKITQLFEEYLKKKQIEIGEIPLRPDMINAASLLHNKYNLVVGLTKSGNTLAALFELLGTPTRYLEYHRNNCVEPVWNDFGRDVAAVGQAERILLCENDAVTGQTLGAILPEIQKLNPSQIDIAFFADRNPGLEDYRNQITNVWLPSQMIARNYWENLLKLEKALGAEALGG